MDDNVIFDANAKAGIWYINDVVFQHLITIIRRRESSILNRPQTEDPNPATKRVRASHPAVHRPCTNVKNSPKDEIAFSERPAFSPSQKLIHDDLVPVSRIELLA